MTKQANNNLRQLLLALLLVAGAMTGRADGGEVLTFFVSGKPMSIPLADTPVITYTGNILHVRTAQSNLDIPVGMNTVGVFQWQAIQGDVNTDGQVGIGDIVAITNFMAGNADGLTKGQADVNGDGDVGIGDIVAITNIMAGVGGTTEPSVLSCPDDNHPHMIDLGLPSGTKWACCNVGANAPEEYGGYFAWGETSTKSYYSWETYPYGYLDDEGVYVHVVDIGSDIAGTGYDAATVNWGTDWRVPSLSQIEELLGNCTSEWVTQNGVDGRRFIGSNGCSIFLPASGSYWEDESDEQGTGGDYWTATISGNDPDNADNAYTLYFYSGGTYRDTEDRYSGHTIRAVSAPPSYLSCPDDNHPHMIDLGLPSGTKWACCNVGANAPEEYGGYFAWGMTVSESNSSNDIVDIGTDIAGTEYDAATANWGAPWRMPSNAQNQELLNNCTHEWTTQNGVNGRKFTSNVNGGTIFLPAAGDRSNGEFDDVGSYGIYWSSTPYDEYGAYGLYFYSDGTWYYGYWSRSDELSVRPVR